jgi:outer membrane biosynthesis protein TonB
VTPEKMPAPAPTPKPKPAPPQAEAKPAPPAPTPKAKPQQQQDDLQALLKNLEKQKQQAERTETPPQRQPAQPQQPQPQAQAAPQRAQASSIDQRRAAAGLEQMVKDQVTPCWNIPAGAKDARDLQIVVAIDLNPDGTLRGNPTVSDASRYESDAFFRAAADSALRALRNPRCTPLKLPYDMYETWKHINFTFDPKEVIG